MSARSPFRSHLLQQWTNSRRSPIALQQWIHSETIREEEEEGGAPPFAAATRSPQQQQQQQQRRSFHSSSPSRKQHDSFDLSSVDTTAPLSIALAASSLRSESNKDCCIQNELHSNPTTAAADYNHKKQQGVENNSIFDVGIFENMNIHEHFATRTKKTHSASTTRSNSSLVDLVGDSAFSWRQTTTNSKRAQKQKNKDPREVKLAMAIDRAVKLSKSTHKDRLRQAQSSGGGEGQQLLTFRRLFSWSRSGQRLADICFEATRRSKGGNDSIGRKEKENWSRIPAVLVAIVHQNQTTTTTTATTTTIDDLDDDDDDDDKLYTPLGYSPPTTEGQLQDYASACAAAQTAVHSLQRDGYSAEWETTSLVTKTPAFRSLLRAKPTDRIVALIKVDDRQLSGRQLVEVVV